MYSSMKKLLLGLSNSYVFILSLALVGGLFFSTHTIHLAPHITIFLAIIFFLTALKIDLKEIWKCLDDKKLLIITNLLMLVIFPIAVYYLALFVYPKLAIAFLILAAMPSGMTAPLLTEICGGKQSLALVLSITTSLLAPFTIPLMIKLLAGATVVVSFSSMSLSLAKIIFIPFILANIIKYFWEKQIKKTYKTFKPISIMLMGAIIMGVIAKQATNIMKFENEYLIYLGLLFAFFIFIHVISYVVIFWKNKKERIATTISLTYFNFTLAIYLAGEFFNEPHIVIFVILSVIPWAILLVPFKYYTRNQRIS